uniref:Uncharacterized protein n=1 Tax=Rhizophora mucronata TaxID=61149 RepID=A0A2P2PIW1_RHIMU
MMIAYVPTHKVMISHNPEYPSQFIRSKNY